MNDINELKQFASVHSRLQGIPDEVWDATLGRIDDDRGGTPGSWVGEWAAVAADLESRGELLAASHCYTLARFPFVDGPARGKAEDDARRTFEAWLATAPGVSRVEVSTPDSTLACWAAGLSTEAPRPLLIFTSGIVSLKEQWAQLLNFADQIGMAVLIGEMPSVGENTMPYGPESWRMYSAIIDAVADQADADHTFLIANSFSGHLALRCAGHDQRIRGVISNAAPVTDFFTDPAWFAQLPQVTVDTLAHLTGEPGHQLLETLPGWALTPGELAALTVPVAYLGSKQDEITPPSEADRLREYVPNITVRQFDDVHASPQHLAETMKWFLGSLMHMRQAVAAPS